MGAGLGEDVPEAQCLVAGAGDDGLAVGRHGEVEHPVGVAGQLGHLHERRVLPHQDLVLRVAVCGDLFLMTVALIITEIPAYSDTGYSDTPLMVTLWAVPKPLLIEIMWLQ